MANLRKRKSLFIPIWLVIIHCVVSQRHSSEGASSLSEECGIQDKDELPDHHAAAPWTAALFSVEGDIFQNQIKPKYLTTAIFIAKDLAITSGSNGLAQFQSQPNNNEISLQLYYGHRASGKQTLIRVRKIEPLNSLNNNQPLPLRVDTLTATRAQRYTIMQEPSDKNSTEEYVELYLLHLESSIDVTSFSRPLCINSEIFMSKHVYDDNSGSTPNIIHISGYASKNESHGSHFVYFSGDREWDVSSWDTDYINVSMSERQVSFGFLPKHFNHGSALAVKDNDHFYLAGILIRSSNTTTTFRSIEKFASMIGSKGLNAKSSSNPRQPPNFEQAHLQRQSTRDPYKPAVDESYENSRRGGQTPTSQLEVNSGSDQHHMNPAGAQITYLHEVEATEDAEVSNHAKFPQSQNTNVERESSRSSHTSRRPGNNDGSNTANSRRTDRNPTNGQQSSLESEYNQKQNPDTSHQNEFKRTTRPQQQSSNSDDGVHPVYHPDVQRPQKIPHQTQTGKCSQDFLEGVDIECLSRSRGLSTTDCIKNAPAGTKIRLRCKEHYDPLDGDNIIEKTCDASGVWLPRKVFACKLDCGNVDRSVPYIVHGSKTESEKWPWHAALFKRVNETTYSYICGATLITRSILITAAHCVHNNIDSEPNDESLYKVVVGAISSEFLSNRKDPQSQEFNIKEIKVNEHYNPRTFEADISLLQIEKPVLLTEYVRPACFPFPSDESKQVSSYQLSEGNQGIVVGFGTTESWSISSTLRMATLPVVSVKNCTTVLERLPSSSQYCAGYTNGTGVCEGDSGGAQIFKDQISKRFFVQGIISHGNRNEDSRCDHEKYTVFTKVGSFAEWVQETVYDLEFDYNRRRRK